MSQPVPPPPQCLNKPSNTLNSYSGQFNSVPNRPTSNSPTQSTPQPPPPCVPPPALTVPLTSSLSSQLAIAFPTHLPTLCPQSPLFTNSLNQYINLNGFLSGEQIIQYIPLSYLLLDQKQLTPFLHAAITRSQHLDVAFQSFPIICILTQWRLLLVLDHTIDPTLISPFSTANCIQAAINLTSTQPTPSQSKPASDPSNSFNPPTHCGCISVLAQIPLQSIGSIQVGTVSTFNISVVQIQTKLFFPIMQQTNALHLILPLSPQQFAPFVMDLTQHIFNQHPSYVGMVSTIKEQQLLAEHGFGAVSDPFSHHSAQFNPLSAPQSPLQQKSTWMSYFSALMPSITPNQMPSVYNYLSSITSLLPTDPKSSQSASDLNSFFTNTPNNPLSTLLSNLNLPAYLLTTLTPPFHPTQNSLEITCLFNDWLRTSISTIFPPISNLNYNICDSYPSALPFPPTMTYEQFLKVARFRSKHRVPFTSFVYNRSILIRCAQPCSGWGQRSLEDEMCINQLKTLVQSKYDLKMLGYSTTSANPNASNNNSSPAFAILQTSADPQFNSRQSTNVHNPSASTLSGTKEQSNGDNFNNQNQTPTVLTSTQVMRQDSTISLYKEFHSPTGSHLLPYLTDICQFGCLTCKFRLHIDSNIETEYDLMSSLTGPGFNTNHFAPNGTIGNSVHTPPIGSAQKRTISGSTRPSQDVSTGDEFSRGQSAENSESNDRDSGLTNIPQYDDNTVEYDQKVDETGHQNEPNVTKDKKGKTLKAVPKPLAKTTPTKDSLAVPPPPVSKGTSSTKSQKTTPSVKTAKTHPHQQSTPKPAPQALLVPPKPGIRNPDPHQPSPATPTLAQPNPTPTAPTPSTPGQLAPTTPAPLQPQTPSAPTSTPLRPREDLIFFDCRPYTAALGNALIHGKGFENAALYNSRVEFLDIPNIHEMRSSYDSWLQLLSTWRSLYHGYQQHLLHQYFTQPSGPNANGQIPASGSHSGQKNGLVPVPHNTPAQMSKNNSNVSNPSPSAQLPRTTSQSGQIAGAPVLPHPISASNALKQPILFSTPQPMSNTNPHQLFSKHFKHPNHINVRPFQAISPLTTPFFSTDLKAKLLTFLHHIHHNLSQSAPSQPNQPQNQSFTNTLALLSRQIDAVQADIETQRAQQVFAHSTLTPPTTPLPVPSNTHSSNALKYQAVKSPLQPHLFHLTDTTSAHFNHVTFHEKYHSLLAKQFLSSTWLQYQSMLLSSCNRIITNIIAGKSALVHCSDNFDRTSQVCIMVQLMLDPYYRTIQGFCTLLERELFKIGHRIKDRHLLGHHWSSQPNSGISSILGFGNKSSTTQHQHHHPSQDHRHLHNAQYGSQSNLFREQTPAESNSSTPTLKSPLSNAQSNNSALFNTQPATPVLSPSTSATSSTSSPSSLQGELPCDTPDADSIPTSPSTTTLLQGQTEQSYFNSPNAPQFPTSSQQPRQTSPLFQSTIHPTQRLYTTVYHYNSHLKAISDHISSSTTKLPSTQPNQISVQHLSSFSLSSPTPALNSHPKHNPVHEYSPIFLQLLETIYQLLYQHPTMFEFNSTFLYDLYISVFSGRYAIFEYNSDNERSQAWNLLYHNLFFQTQQQQQQPTLSPATNLNLNANGTVNDDGTGETDLQSPTNPLTPIPSSPEQSASQIPSTSSNNPDGADQLGLLHPTQTDKEEKRNQRAEKDKGGSNLLDAFFWSSLTHPATVQRFFNPLYNPQSLYLQSNTHITHTQMGSVSLMHPNVSSNAAKSNQSAYTSLPVHSQQNQQGPNENGAPVQHSSVYPPGVLFAKHSVPDLVIFKELYLTTLNTYIYHPNQHHYYHQQSHPHFDISTGNSSIQSQPQSQRTASSHPQTPFIVPFIHLPQQPPNQYSDQYSYRQTIIPSPQTIFPPNYNLPNEIKAFIHKNPELDICLPITQQSGGWLRSIFGGK